MKTAYESYRAELAAIREAGTYKDCLLYTSDAADDRLAV